MHVVCCSGSAPDVVKMLGQCQTMFVLSGLYSGCIMVSAHCVAESHYTSLGTSGNHTSFQTKCR